MTIIIGDLSTEDEDERHTPGPWKTANFNKAQEPYGAAIYYELADDDNAAVDIAHMILDGRAPWAMEADARLIAAAPDMLAALKGLITPKEGASPTTARANARAAIAKAELR